MFVIGNQARWHDLNYGNYWIVKLVTRLLSTRIYLDISHVIPREISIIYYLTTCIVCVHINKLMCVMDSKVKTIQSVVGNYFGKQVVGEFLKGFEDNL